MDRDEDEDRSGFPIGSAAGSELRETAQGCMLVVASTFASYLIINYSGVKRSLQV